MKPLMQLKPYIALFFALAFLVKLVAIDSKITTVLHDSSAITLINPFCPKQHLHSHNNHEKFNSVEVLNKHTINVTCSSVYELNSKELTRAFNTFDYLTYDYRFNKVLTPPTPKFYPPPKIF
ncbi:hypothetical protein L1I30_09325 [Gillisia sp. M10.2A]|uniref:Uncharacterized protein n=1 Tax=Gillisia lutea TaxID=2909668 RepID=A0ABS9EK79_9FLAO|nr:hypothetical protein [Gillisia lutea]MCF4101866.1 hypothetical protein [Gillisia lutea]